MNLIASLTDGYFRPWELEALFYRRLGVRRFKRYLPTGGDLHANRIGWHPILDRSGGLAAALSRFERRTRVAETAHLLTFLLFSSVCAAGLAGGHLGPVLLIFAFNVAINVYPIMVQRYNRHRILRLLERRPNPVRRGEPG